MKALLTKVALLSGAALSIWTTMLGSLPPQVFRGLP